MSNSVVALYTEKDLFNYIQSLRLNKAKELNDINIENNKAREGESFKNIFRKINNMIGKYDQKDTSIDDSLDQFNKKNDKVISSEEAKGTLLSLFSDDKNGVSKLLFSIRVILDRDYDYKYEKEGLEVASSFLYNDASKLRIIKNELENIYKDISGKSLSSVQKGLLVGVAASAFAISFIVPAAGVAGISHAGTVLAAKGLGHLAVSLSTSLLFSAAIFGGTYLAMKEANKEAARKAFKKATVDEQNIYLSIQCLIIKQLRKSLNDHDFKEELDSILKSLNTLKSDLDYFLFVEKEDVSINKSKLNSFHGFDKKLVDILL